MKSALIAALFAGAALASAIPAVDDPVSTPSPTQLTSGAYWIRAVVAPNYHKYLQTIPANVPGTAVLESYTTAGQFNIEDGQLVNKVSNPPLYMWVEEPADKANPPRTLATTFKTTKNPFGTFAWQGDTLTWSVASIKRQNVAAWLVCAKQGLFINTGAYAYQTPSGCADQTVRLVSHDLFSSTVTTNTAGPVRFTTTTTRRQITKGGCR
jgi:hypothetical protein